MFLQPCLSMVGLRPSSSVSTSCVVPLRGVEPFFATLTQDRLADCDQLGNRTPATERTDRAIHSCSHWATPVMGILNIYIDKAKFWTQNDHFFTPSSQNHHWPIALMASTWYTIKQLLQLIGPMPSSFVCYQARWKYSAGFTIPLNSCNPIFG